MTETTAEQQPGTGPAEPGVELAPEHAADPQPEPAPEGEPAADPQPEPAADPQPEPAPEGEPSEPVEPTEPGQDPEPSPGPDPEGLSASSEAEIQAAMKKLAQSATTWRNRVSAVLGEDAQHLVACELCEPDIPGFHWPAEYMQPSDAVQARLLAVLTGPPERELRPAKGLTECPECGGEGQVATPSKVPGRETKGCETCKGWGYTPVPGLPTSSGTAGEVAHPLADTNGEQPPPEDADVWGSPRLLEDGRENPNYGKMPQYKDAALP